MNRLYRTVFNRSLGVWQAASELVKCRGTGGNGTTIHRVVASGVLLGGLVMVVSQVQAQSVIDGGTTVTVTVDYPSPWNAGNSLIIGQTGTGTLIIENGGQVSNTNSTIGSTATGNGTVTVDGVGSTWTNSEMLIVGQSGTGTLNITEGGAVMTGADSGGGTNIGAGGTVTVNGSGSSLTYGYGGLQVNGDLSVTDGGQVTSPNNRGGASINSGATLTVDGTNSKLTSVNMSVNAGGMMSITNGGNVVNSGASGDAINGTVSVDGAGSTWTNNGNFFMGNAAGANPRIVITNGGVANLLAGGQMTANNGSSSALITVDGTGSQLNTGGTFSMQGINSTDPAAIRVTNGGALKSAAIQIGRSAGDIAEVTIDGSTSTWTTTGGTSIGLQGTGTAKLTNGAVMTSGGSITVGAQKGSTGTFDISGGSRVNAVNASGALQGLTVGGAALVRSISMQTAV